MKSNFFNPLQLRHLMSHKGNYLKAIATEEGLRLCPDFAQGVIHVLDPVPVKMDVSDIRDEDGRYITYMIEDGYKIAKLADMIDFTKAEIIKENDVLYFVVGKKHFCMKLFSASAPYFDLNLENYAGTVEWNDAATKAFKKCSVACADDICRLYLQGVYVDSENDTLVATDGRRMTYHKSDFVTSGFSEFGKFHPEDRDDNDFILPANVIRFLDGYTKVSYAFHDVKAEGDNRSIHRVYNWWKLETGFHTETYLFNPIEGRFPNWRKVVPEFSDSHYEHKVVTFDFEGMKNFRKAGKNDLMKCTFHDGTCTQMYDDELELDLGVAFPLPEGVDMSCNAQFLIDGVDVFGKQAEVDIALPDPDEGHILKAVDIADKDNLLHYVIMPMNA